MTISLSPLPQLETARASHGGGEAFAGGVQPTGLHRRPGPPANQFGVTR
jgi:hypothetical protein